MRKFDTKVQHLKYKVLREVARFAWNDTLLENVLKIPEICSIIIYNANFRGLIKCLNKK